MIKIEIPEQDWPGYEAWRKRAIKRRLRDISRWKPGEKLTLNEELYKELRDICLAKIFNEKCAYCEGKHVDGYTPQVEHYRPKLAVTEGRKVIDHSGYYWLAYEWENLLLSCGHCNSRHSNMVEGRKEPHEGKLNEFRVRGKRVTGPSNRAKWKEQLKAEEPLLLNPYFDDPAEHIQFDDKGVPYPKNKSERGRETIEVCHLYRIKLVDARMEAAKKLVRTRISDRLYELEKSADAADKPYFDRSEEFSAWLNHYTTLKIRQLNRPLGGDKDPAPSPVPVVPNPAGEGFDSSPSPAG